MLPVTINWLIGKHNNAVSEISIQSWKMTSIQKPRFLVNLSKWQWKSVSFLKSDFWMDRKRFEPEELYQEFTLCIPESRQTGSSLYTQIDQKETLKWHPSTYLPFTGHYLGAWYAKMGTFSAPFYFLTQYSHPLGWKPMIKENETFRLNEHSTGVSRIFWI